MSEITAIFLKKVLLLPIILVFGITFSLAANAQMTSGIPDWIKNNAGWWASGEIDDTSFINGIKFLIENNIMVIDTVTTDTTADSYPDLGDFYLVYDTEIDPSWYELEGIVQSWEYFEDQVYFLNEVFVLPFDVAIVLTQCDESNAYWTGENMIICYELIDETFYKFDFAYGDSYTYEELEYSVINVIDHVLYHELGHAFIHLYGIPVTGMEEDVADQFSAYIIGEFSGGVVGLDTLRDAAFDYYLASSEYELQPTYFADVHSLNIQRYYNLACWVYGIDTIYNADLITEGWLDIDRAYSCQDEYATIVNSWDTLLAPFYK